MIKNYIKIAIRNLWKYKGFSFINISGLSVGIAFTILTMLFIKNERSHDSSYKHQADMYSLVTETKKTNGETQLLGRQPADLVPLLKKEFPEIKHVGYAFWGDATITHKDKTFNEHVLFASNSLISMFDMEFVQGNLATALLNSNEIILSEEMAKKYFGNENPIGQILRFETRKGPEDLFVTAVAKRASENSSLHFFDCMVDYSKHERYNINIDNWTNIEGDILLQLNKETTPLSVQRKISLFLSSFRPGYDMFLKSYNSREKNTNMSESYQFRLLPLKDVYFNTSFRTRFLGQGKPRDSYILAGITLLVLIIACINFMILSIARSANRAREVGMRKVFGAARLQLMKQFWGEAFLLCLVAMVAGLAIARLLLPEFNQLMARNLSLADLSNGWFVACIIGVLVFLALVAGSYPAVFLSRFQPSEVLKGKFKIGGNNPVTKTLIVFQFGLSILLVSVTIGILKQMNFIQATDPGFNPANVINIRTRTGFYSESPATLVERFRNRAMSSPLINDVSGTGEFSFKTFSWEGDEKASIIIPADEEFLNTLKIELINGRNFFRANLHDEQKAVIVNETFLHQLGLNSSAIGRQLNGISDSALNGLEIIGVVKDFHLMSFKKRIEPLMIRPMKDHDGMLVRIAAGDPAATLEFLQNVWKEVAPGKPFEYQILDKALQSDYRNDRRLKKITEFSAGFAIFLACLGLIGLVSIGIINRTKEIGIRKVMGASVKNVVVLLLEDFIKLILLANIIGLPVAYIFLNNWLQDYAYRTSLSGWIFLLAAGLTIGTALIVIGFQAIKAAIANPVKSLRTE
jgi:putative ABC transport system permease protein